MSASTVKNALYVQYRIGSFSKPMKLMIIVQTLVDFIYYTLCVVVKVLHMIENPLKHTPTHTVLKFAISSCSACMCFTHRMHHSSLVYFI